MPSPCALLESLRRRGQHTAHQERQYVHMTADRTRLAWISPFTRRVVNPLTRRFAGRLPWFGLVTHVGRRSGTTYHTPLNVFRHGDGYVFALTYGPDVNWVRNIRAAGGCTMRTRGRTVRLVD